jgi:acetate kinase
MKILVLNAGSSSQKSALYVIPQDSPTDSAISPLWSGQADWSKDEGNVEITITAHGTTTTKAVKMSSRREIIVQMLKTLWSDDSESSVLQHTYSGDVTPAIPMAEIDMVGHRIVHGGPDYAQSVLITPQVKDKLTHLTNFAPLHNQVSIEGIEIIEELKPDMPQIAVFDTTFHRHIPAEAATYAGPYNWIAQGIRRYGFHGLSHQYCAQRSAQIVHRDLATLRIVNCHLGNGSSLAAIRAGQSIDTTMGFTPLDGLMMGSRSGTIDPSILFYLQRQHGYSTDQLETMLNKASGLQGISGVSGDMRQISQAIKEGNERAKLARNMYIYRVRSSIGAMIAVLGGCDVLTFTGGIGEHDADLRTSVCQGFSYMQLKLDEEKNTHMPVDQDIAATDSHICILVIHTEEDWEIARECQRYYEAAQFPAATLHEIYNCSC